MKKILMNIGIGYLCIGGFMGTITGISYAYAQAFVLFSMGWGMFSLSGLSFLMLSGYLIVVMPIIKTFLWLPSLIMWFNEPGLYSFWMWLAPGFFAEAGIG
jgi:hypothetical protein|tara:strand:- start:136 stop:438 length:303 start_codon:yes stop_codon:yes gene_type:complete